MRIGLLSDTHGFLDDAVLRRFEDCDEIWHAGDLGSLEVLQRLRDFKPIRAVSGNVDGPEISAEIPGDLVWETEGLRVFMTHIGGYPGHYNVRARKAIEAHRPGLFLCGHSHIVKIMRDPARGLLHLNPGACGHQGWHRVRTVMRFAIESGAIAKVEVVELGARGRTTGRARRTEV